MRVRDWLGVGFFGGMLALFVYGAWAASYLTTSGTYTNAPDGLTLTNPGTPTVASCGTNPSVSGTDQRGVITVGSGVSVTGCTLSWSQTFSSAPGCVVSASGTAAIVGWSASTTALTLSLSVSLASGSISYICFEH